MNKLYNYIKLFKFPRMIFFLEVVLGYIVASNFTLNKNSILLLIEIFFSFSLLLYSGIYIINDILDKKMDEKHPEKKFRPIASGLVSVKEGVIFAILMILIGLISGYFISMTLFIMEIIFVLINFIYSVYLKHIPYIEFLSNGITHPLRFYLGVLMTGSFNYKLAIICAFLVTIALSILKRENETLKKQTEFRKTLKNYKLIEFYFMYILIFLFMIIIFIKTSGISRIVTVIGIIVFSILIIGYHSTKNIRKKIDYILRF